MIRAGQIAEGTACTRLMVGAVCQADAHKNETLIWLDTPLDPNALRCKNRQTIKCRRVLAPELVGGLWSWEKDAEKTGIAPAPLS
jgi:hypothetical protein